MNFRNNAFLFLPLFLLACASTDPQLETVYIKKLTWEKYKGCSERLEYYQRKEGKQFFICSIKYIKGMPKLYPDWEEGKEYMALATKDREFQLEPIYDQIYIPKPASITSSAPTSFLYRKKKGDFFTRYDVVTNTKELTPIDHLEPGKVHYRSPIVDKVSKENRLYSGAFSDNMKNYYILDNELKIIKKIQNVDNDIDRKLIFPPVHSLSITHNVPANGRTRMIRHNLNGRVYYQVYDTQGNKVGDEIAYEKVTYFFQKTNFYLKSVAYDVRPWVDKGSGVYMPIIHYGANGFFDGTKDYGDYLGQYIEPDNNKNYEGIFVGYQYPREKIVKKSRSTSMVFKDDKGIYMTRNWFDFHAAETSPEAAIIKLKQDPKNFYRELIRLPFYPGTLTTKGDLVEEEIVVFKDLDDSYSVSDVAFTKYMKASIHPVNSFSSVQEVETTLIKIQEDIIARAKIRAEKNRKEREFQDSIDAARARTDAIMAGSRADRDRRQNDHAARMAVIDHNKKYEKPNPLLNLDLKKIMDTAGAKRKAACYKKMSDSKKKYLSGQQGWYYQGKCK